MFKRTLFTALATAATLAFAASAQAAFLSLGTSNTSNATTTLTGNPTSAELLVKNTNGSVFSAFGLYGLLTDTAPTAGSAAVRGANSSSNSLGYGLWGSQAGSGTGVYGTAATDAGIGVYGRHLDSTGAGPGVRGQTASATGAGVLGVNTGGGPGLQASVNAGIPPLKVNSDAKVTSLNADQLDGIDSNGFWKLGGNNVGAPAILGTTTNQPLELRVNGQRALRLEPSLASVLGGGQNTASGLASTAVGGVQNVAQGDYSFAAGRNAHAGDGSFVWADSHFWGFSSTAPDQFAVRATGGARFISGDALGTPTSGVELPAGTSGWSTAAPGQPFDLSLNGHRGFRIDPASDGTNLSPNVIGGIADNSVTPGVHSAVIGGGGRGVPANPATANRVTDHQGTVGGGANNQAGDDAGTVGDATLATVGGGGNNIASGEAATVGGGFFDSASGFRATVGGGDHNDGSGYGAAVGGGESNSASGIDATIGGGSSNTATANVATVAGGNANHSTNTWSTVGGGTGNQATGSEATISGGEFNTAGGLDAAVGGGSNNHASARGATAAGGEQNQAGGQDSITLGGQQNLTIGDDSLAAGTGADAAQDGTFVWADKKGFLFTSTAANQFSVRATGGARFVSAIDNSGSPTAGVKLDAGGGSWSSLSDRASKRGMRPVSGREVLRKLGSLPISTWSYRAQKPSIHHLGPMAQDFHAAFGLGEDNRHIDSIDSEGVALAAIQGLYRQNRALERQNHSLSARMGRLERQVRRLATQKR